MISPKIKALFQFIEYLHSSIENFNRYNELIKELVLLDKKRQKLSPENNYKDKQKYDKIQAELEFKFKILQDNTAKLIKAKAKELNVCNFDNAPNYSYNGVEAEIHQLKKNFSDEDLPEIFKHKRYYLEYRSQTHKTFLSLQFFFENLDKITKSLFDYFKDTERNEFESLENKPMQVNSIQEAIKEFKQGQTKFHIHPTPQNKTKSRILKAIADFNFFQISVIADLEYEGKVYKDVKQKHNDSILTPENWEQHKETFFNQRMATYKDSYTLAEKIKLELVALEKLTINKTDYQILKDRYIDYLNTIRPKPIAKKIKPELDENNLSEKIKKHFGFLLRNCPRKGKPILSNENDFNKLIEWTTYFYEHNFEVPEISNPINSVNTNKYITQLAFHILFDELRKAGFHNQRTKAKTLFNLWESSFLDYKGDKESNFWKVKKKNDNGNDYDIEVKKLMLID